MKLFTFFLLTIISYNSYSKDRLEIYIETIKPWIIVEDKKCATGVICNIFNQINSLAQLDIKFTVTSLARANKASFSGMQALAVYPKSPELDKLYQSLGVIFKYDSGLMLKKDSSLKSINSKTSICTTRENPHLKKTEYSLYEVEKIPQCFKMLEANRVEGIYLSSVEKDYYQTNIELIKKLDFHKVKDHILYLYMSRKLSDKNKKRIRNAFKLIKDKM